MSFIGALLGWASLPYVVTQGVAMGFAALQASGLLGMFGSDDHDGEHDVDAEGDSDAEGDHDADADGEHDADSDGAPHFSVWADLGVGRVPLSILWQTYAFSFGATGLAAHAVYLSQTGRLPLISLVWSAPLAFLVGYFVTRQVSRVVAKVVSNPLQEATSRAALVGTTGVVISTKVDAAFGEVRILDRSGHMVRVVCSVPEGEAPVAEKREVVVVEYDKARDRLLIAPIEEHRGSADKRSRSS